MPPTWPEKDTAKSWVDPEVECERSMRADLSFKELSAKETLLKTREGEEVVMKLTEMTGEGSVKLFPLKMRSSRRRELESESASKPLKSRN